jgi:hypothetical protein
MGRILVNDEWYEQLADTALYEVEYERIVGTQAPSLFPQFRVVHFKCTVVSEDGDSKQPDLALISYDYRDWWVVEVELAHHDFEGHVLPQVRTLARGVYSDVHAAHLCGKNPSLDSERVIAMIKGKQPKVLVVLNSPKPEWIPRLRPFDASVVVFEVFRSERNRYVYRLNGERPKLPQDVITKTRFHPAVPRFLLVDSPGALDVRAQEDVSILFRDRVTRWRRVDMSDAVWLAPLGPNVLDTHNEYELVIDSSGQLAFRTTPVRRP